MRMATAGLSSAGGSADSSSSAEASADSICSSMSAWMCADCDAAASRTCFSKAMSRYSTYANTSPSTIPMNAIEVDFPSLAMAHATSGAFVFSQC